jgi:hypothetical protein
MTGTKSKPIGSLLNTRTSIEANYHHNCVAGDDKTMKFEVFAAELTGVKLLISNYAKTLS